MSSSFSRAAFHRKMETNFGPSPNDPNRCITDCKVWPKGVEPPIAIAKCIVFRTYLVITRLLARGIGVARISRKSKKEVQHHRYRLICTFVCLVVWLFLINLNRFLFTKVRWWWHAYSLVSFPWVDWHVDYSSWSAIYGVVEEGGWRCVQLRARKSRQGGTW